MEGVDGSPSSRVCTVSVGRVVGILDSRRVDSSNPSMHASNPFSLPLVGAHQLRPLLSLAELKPRYSKLHRQIRRNSIVCTDAWPPHSPQFPGTGKSEIFRQLNS